jgi:hypothetical protein
MYRRGISSGLIAVLLITALALAIPVSAQPSANSFGVNDALGNPGTVVSVPVLIENAQNGPIISLIFSFTYNTSVITVSSVQRGALTSFWDSPAVNTVGGTTTVNIVYNGTTAIAIQNVSSGSVALINFSVVGAGGSSSGMNLSNIQFSDPVYQVGTAPAEDGIFTVDAGAPVVSNPDANPASIQANGVQEARLNVTVVDDSPGNVVVSVNLTQLGGPAARALEKIDGTRYSTTTNATPGTAPGLYYLPITATDVLGNANTTERVALTIAPPPVGTVMGKLTYACNGTAIAAVSVNLTQNGSLIVATTTNGSGVYAFADRSPGEYAVNASKLRFWPNSTQVTITAGATVTANLMLWLKGDLNNNCLQADAGDLAKMKDAAVGKISSDPFYDLNENGLYVDAGDVAKMKDATVGKIELL